MSARDCRTAAVVAAAVALVLLPGVFVDLPAPRGKAVAGACRVLAGDVPYRDFWTMYAPGQFYAVAGLFAALGRELWVQAAAAVAVQAVAAGLVCLLARRLGAPPLGAAAIALVLGISLFTRAPELGSYPPVLPLIAGALLLISGYLLGASPSRLAAAGALLGLAAAFKHDVAAYMALGASAGLSIAWAIARERRPASWSSPAGAIARLLGSAALVVAPLALLLAWRAGPDAWRDLIVFPAGDFRAVRSEPWPGLLPSLGPLRDWLAAPLDPLKARDAGGALSGWILCRMPELAFLAGVAILAGRRRAMDPRRLAVLALLLAPLPLFWMAAHIQKNTHLTTMALLSLLAGVVVWGELRRGSWARGAVLAAGAVYAAGLLVPAAMEGWLCTRGLRWNVPLELPGTLGIRVAPRQRHLYRELTSFVRQNVPPGEPIHVGLWRHDTVVVSDMRFHYLCDRPPATRYHELHPGVTDREDVQREMLADLEAKQVRCAILWRFGWPDELLDRIRDRRVERIPQCGSTLLDDYFRAEFEPVLEEGEFTLLWRKGAPAGD
jgi:hypothetical protein